MYLITGLAQGRVAVYTKVHHAAIDGASGAELLTVLLDLAPEGRDLPPAEPFRPQRAPGRGAVGVRTALHFARRPVQTAKLAIDLVKVLPTLGPAISPVVGGMLGLGNRGGDGGVIATSHWPCAGNTVQQGDHATPSGRVPQRRPG